MLKKSLIPTPLQVREAHRLDPSLVLRPVRRWRLLFIFGLLLRVLWHRFMTRLRPPTGRGGKYTPQRLAQDVRISMERLGGMWIKTAQIMAMRRDLFSTELCDELSSLHDHAVGFPGDIACKIIEADLGCPILEVFTDFDVVPIAAASIGQVHVARLRETGVKVAIKVQRPDIADSFQRDMRIVSRYLMLLQLFRIRPWARWDEMFLILQRTLADELDYRLELASIRRMRRTLRHDKIYAPRVFPRYCTPRVLVMEFIDGVLMSDYMRALHDDPQKAKRWCKKNNIRPKKVGQRLYLSFLMQFFTDNLLHGDLHPGNIMLLKNNRLALIDFGSISTLDKGFLEKYALSLKALTRRDYSKYVDVFLSLIPGLPSIDIEKMRAEVVRQLEAWEAITDSKGIPYEKRSLTAVSTKMVEIFGRYKLPPLWSTLRAGRSLAALDASLKFLLPEVNFIKLNQRYYERVQSRMLSFMASKQSRQGLVSSINDLMRIPASIGENLVFQGELIRKRAMTFQGQLSKAAAVGKAVLTSLINIGLIATVFMIARYLSKQNDLSRTAIAALPVRDIFSSMPYLPPGVWVVVIVLTIYLLRSLWKLVKILALPGTNTNPWL